MEEDNGTYNTKCQYCGKSTALALVHRKKKTFPQNEKILPTTTTTGKIFCFTLLKKNKKYNTFLS